MKRLDEIFDIWYGVNLEVVNCEVVKVGMPFVSRQSVNNGIVCYVKSLDITPNPANTLSIAASGSVLTTFYHDYEYYSGRDVYIAQPKKPLSIQEMLFYCYVIEQNKYRYNYGRAANRTLRDILVPTPEEISLQGKNEQVFIPFDEKPLSNKHLQLNTENWKWFEVGILFEEIYKAEAHVKIELNINKIKQQNNVAFVSRTENNNGCDCYVTKTDNIIIENGNAIIIGDTTATCFYQENEFTTGDHIVVCRACWMNKYNAMFIVSIINKERYRFNYGRAFKMDIIKSSKIKLPATADGTPDWQFMEDYIKGLPYSGCL